MVTIWEGIRDYFAGSPAEMDFVLFSNYGRQVDALLQGTIDLAWNTNLAWVRTVAQTKGACRALAMRDTDTVFRTMFVARAGSGLGGLEDLTGRRLALGSRDSAQAAILPVHFLTRAGLAPGEVDFLRIDSDVGKHGDTGRSELDALRAVLDDRADAAAIGINTWEAIGRDELRPGPWSCSGNPRPTATATSPPCPPSPRSGPRLGSSTCSGWTGTTRRTGPSSKWKACADGWPPAGGLRIAVRGGARAADRLPMVDHVIILDLVERTAAVADGATVAVPLGPGDPGPLAETVAAWCARTGNELLAVRDGAAIIRRGRAPDPLVGLAPGQMPGTRLWMYTNFDCNLACDYCYARSSPQTARRALGIDRVRRLAGEAVQAGVSELLITAGEPFLLPDLDDLVAACTNALPPTLLTNGMLFRGNRLERLRRKDRNTARAADQPRLRHPRRPRQPPRDRIVAAGRGRHPDSAGRGVPGQGRRDPSRRAGPRTPTLPRLPRLARHRTR
ncbi:PhnD/SsuA/transferrin family substrate-binding protein [Arthrobacter sp. A5]|uniref:PhnD/SsuA/transferrin family substrate-binding protein n=1 Tax=Arthrobacter sp. A5 TaxID=576926 RepID=UPI003DAA0EDB